MNEWYIKSTMRWRKEVLESIPETRLGVVRKGKLVRAFNVILDAAGVSIPLDDPSISWGEKFQRALREIGSPSTTREVAQKILDMGGGDDIEYILAKISVLTSTLQRRGKLFKAARLWRRSLWGLPEWLHYETHKEQIHKLEA